MPDTFEGLTFLPGATADQSIVRIQFRDAKGDRLTRTLSLFDAMVLARALEPVRNEAVKKGWL